MKRLSRALRRLPLVAFAAVALLVAAPALAQAPAPEQAPTPAPEHPAAPAPEMHTPEGTPAEPHQHPPAETAAEGEGQGAHEGGEEEGHHEVGPPPAFNFADFDRFAKEKEAAKEGHGTPVIPYVYILVNALILYLMYYYLGKKPISEGLQARRDTIAKELDEATKIKEEAQAKLEEYTERLDKLDSELDRLKAELTLAGEKDRDRIVKEAEEKAARMKKDAQFLLDQEMKQLRIDLQKYAVDAAMRAAESAIKGKLSSQDHDRVAEEFVTNIGKLPPPGAKGVTKSGGAS